MIDRDVLHHRMLVYLYDPDKGEAAEIEQELHEMKVKVDEIIQVMAEWAQASGPLLEGAIVPVQDLENRLEIANADRLFYTDVWGKIKEAVHAQNIPC